MNSFKTSILNNIKNWIGWKTSRKLVIFAVDDYGNVRLDSSKARENMNNAGFKINSRFDAFDSLENRVDLEALFDTLNFVKDKHGNPAIFTVFAVPCNINFEQMASEDYRTYKKEFLQQTFKKLSEKDPEAYKGTWNLWGEGIKKRLIHPEFHGREHFNLKVFNEKLKRKDLELMTV